MNKNNLQSSFTNRLRRSAPKQVAVNTDDLISFVPCSDNRHCVIAKPNRNGVILSEWIRKNESLIQSKLLEFGAVLFRGFSVSTQKDFINSVSASGHPLLDYNDRSTPRTALGNNVYTSTEYPPDQRIPLHNENSYSFIWPDRLWFWCEIEPESGGETTLADSKLIYEAIDNGVKEEFKRKKIRYVSNYRAGLGLSWQNAFQTMNKNEVELYCKSHDIQFEWTGDDSLRTTRQGNAITTHPMTGEVVWFNQAHLFNTNSLPDNIKIFLHSLYDETELPRQSYFGDGTNIEAEVVAHISSVYEKQKTTLPWKRQDLLLIDNLLKAHGRNSFTSDRRVLVAMTKIV